MAYCLCPTRLTPLFGLALVIASCGVTQVKDADPEAVAALNGLRYPSPDAQLGEHLYPDEKTIADKLSVVIEESIRKQYSAGTARRDAHPVFFATDPARYLSFMDDANSDHFYRKLFIPFDLGAKGTLIALKTGSSKISNPVQARYWSMVPYQLGAGDGRQAVKYSARGCSATTGLVPKNPEHDFLRDALRHTLQSGDACMEFLVQPRTSDSMDVDDSRIEWREAAAPFYKLATIRIPQQTFDTPEQNTFCENLSFTPWHALPEHEPLGVTNRLRKVIYDHISRVRHEINDAKREELQAPRAADAH